MDSSKAYNYQHIFNKVLNKRLKYVLNVNLIWAVILSVIYNFMPFTTGSSSLGTGFLTLLCVKVPAFFIALTVIRQLRRQYLVVDYSNHKTLGSQIYYSIISSNFLVNWAGYYVSSFLIYSVLLFFNFDFTFDYYLLSKEYRKYPLINDEWVYFWYHVAFVSFFYTCNQLIFQRQRLNFQFGVKRNNPENYLFKHLPFLLGNSFGLNLFIIVLTPVTYWVIKYYIYKSFTLITLILGLDTVVPPFNTSITTFAKLGYSSFFLILSWEVVNHTFNVYATIGCLDGKKPISTYSSDPIQCLLSGLRDVDPKFQLSRLTAFQELAYLATSADKEAIKLRLQLFSARSKKTHVWPAIFEECSLVIQETTDRINYRSSSDLAALKTLQLGIKNDINVGFKKDNDIFGNSFISSPSKSPDVMKKYQPEQKETQHKPNKWVELFNQQVVLPVKSLITTFTTQYFKPHGIKFNYSKYLKIYYEYKNKFSETSFGVFFRTTLKRDGESRVINPVNFGNAIISISNLVQFSTEEGINDDVCKLLNLLEHPIRATTNYIDYLPASIYLTPHQKENSNYKRNLLIGILHDLAIHEFYQICIKFNGKLNDLILTLRTYKLAKWVIDKEIAIQQEKQQQSQQRRRGL
ncbi:Nucleoporin NDC1 [Candida viswanathii]|uniref:Nucleoporin NDC1 n=1 Tax=Candida viswanathii TaxID=5486 RepID=A0A367XWZ8_9ASCO|nr:Nucleoporin NDC1 [Candida viswanathii]